MKKFILNSTTFVWLDQNFQNEHGVHYLVEGFLTVPKAQPVHHGLGGLRCANKTKQISILIFRSIYKVNTSCESDIVNFLFKSICVVKQNCTNE
jgi:hypothetical protein